ncbi:MAG TPA: hypothetical protein VF278_05155 [Pirellulales bacterium]
MVVEARQGEPLPDLLPAVVRPDRLPRRGLLSVVVEAIDLLCPRLLRMVARLERGLGPVGTGPRLEMVEISAAEPTMKPAAAESAAVKSPAAESAAAESAAESAAVKSPTAVTLRERFAQGRRQRQDAAKKEHGCQTRASHKHSPFM